MTDRAVNPLVPVMIKFSAKTLQPGKALQRSGLCVCVTDRADRPAAANGKLVLMATDAGGVTGSAGETDARRVVVAAVTKQTRHPSMRRIRMKKVGEIHLLRLGRYAGRLIGLGRDRSEIKTASPCITKKKAR